MYESKLNGIKHIKYQEYVMICLYIIIAFCMVWAFTGQWPWNANAYNSYTLQACAWLEGRLDLGRDYPHLELAIYGNQYYVSFPPFPSFIMLPFALIFKERTPDGWIALFTTLLGAIYAAKLYTSLKKERKQVLFWVIFLFLGTNVLFTSINGWVWFIAQNMSITLSMMALYYATKANITMSLFFWACAVGCRPFQVTYFPLLLCILYGKIKSENTSITLLELIKRKWFCAIPMCCVALSYMILNYMRFGSIIEFGHNYLPEFVRSKQEGGQFSLSYVAANFKNLMRLPKVLDTGQFDFYNMNGVLFLLVSPIYISYFYCFIRNLVQRKKVTIHFVLIISVSIHIFLLMCHRTMGGWHFGNRYINDTLPFVFFGVIALQDDQKECVWLDSVLCHFGILLNVIGTIAVYNHWI